jgi:glycosyltransferase involved in cell wall biosynthesis
MKILWVNPSFLDYRIAVYEQLNKLTDGNFYLAYSKERVPKRCVDKIGKILGNNALGLEKEKTFRFGMKGDFANTGIQIPYPKGLYKLISSVEQPDIILGEGYFQWTPWAIFRAKRLKVPFLLAYERTAHTERNCPWWRKLYRKIVDCFISGYVVNGSETKLYLESTGINSSKITTGVMSADSIALSQYACEISSEEKENLKKEWGLSKGITFLYVGRLIELKGVKYLLEAWSKYVCKYPNDNLLIVGNGPLLQSFRQKYGDGMNIHFTGAIDYDAIYKYYAIADVFVIPTLEDNWSLVVPEAMACGLPIATSIYNGCYPDLVIENKNGVLFDTLKENTILSALEYFHFVDIADMGKQSIEIEKDYNPEKAALRIYQACLNVVRTNN